MNKTSTRLASIAGIVLLGACAIALAQHDSRKREKEPLNIQSIASSQAEPIQLDPAFMGRDSSSPAIVRANNDRLTGYGALPETLPENSPPSSLDANPLRSTSAPTPYDDAQNAANDLSSAASDLQAEFANYPRESLPPMPAYGNESGPSTADYDLAYDQFPEVSDQATLDEASLRAGASLVSASTPIDPPTGALPQTKPAANPDAAAPPPAWLNGPSAPLPAAIGGLPQLPTAKPTQSSAPAPTAAANNLQPLPNLPTSSLPPPSLPASKPAVNPAAPPAYNTPSYGAARSPGVNNNTAANNMSDTQRGILPPTDLTANNPASPSAASSSSTYGSAPSSTAGAAPSSTYGSAQPRRTPSAGYGNNNYATGNEVPSLPPTASPYGPASNAGSNTTATTSTTTDSAFRNPAYGQSSAAQPTGSLASLVSNQPGNRYLDGSQNPVLQIQKRAPEEIQVGKPATFVISVRNAGNSAAHDVTVVDSVPRGSRFVDAVPPVTPGADGLLAWKLGEIGAGEERTITLQIVPEVQGEVGSVATVHFAARASVRTVATMPKLEIRLLSEPEVLIGNAQLINVTIKNTGTGVARRVRLEADIPEQLQHERGDRLLEAVLGDIRPNEERTIALRTTAVQPGQAACSIRAVTDDGLQAEEIASIDVKAPQLIAQIQGPKRRYLERQATYQFAVKNTGTAAATNLEFSVNLPSGLTFNSANNNGSYDRATHSVVWALYELPAGEPAVMELAVLPVELGPQAMSFTAKGDLGITAESRGQLVVEGLAELAFTIGQDNGTIEVGSSSTYSVQVTNIGNMADRNVQLTVDLPSGTEVLDINAPTKSSIQGRKIVFEPVPEMRNKDQYTYRFQVRHNEPGKQIVRTQLTSENWPQPVVKEEGTLVYNDQN